MSRSLSFFSRKNVLSFFPVLVTALIIGGLIYILPSDSWGKAFDALRSLPLAYWGYVSCAIVINTAIIALRLTIMASYSGSHLSFFSAFKVIATTALTGMCAPFIGGLLGQKWALRHQGSHFAVPSYLFEKIITAAVGGGFSLCGVFILWPDSPLIEIALSWHFTQKVMGSFFVLVCLFLFYLTPDEKKKIYSFFTGQTLAVVLKLCALSAVSWILMASTFLGGLFYFMPCTPFIKSLSASIMVSFLASMPISVSGWSVREFFSIEIFKFLDLPQSQALGLSIGIGAVSLLTVVVLGGFFTYKNYRGSILVQEKTTVESRNLSSLFIKGLTYFACIFVFFQYWIPLGAVTINFCPADIAAGCGFVLGVPLLWKNRLSWRFISLRSFVCSTFLIFVVSFAIGWARWGWSPWSFTKLMGWVIMMGYALLMTLFVQQEGYKGMRRAVALLASTLVFVILFEILCQWGAVLFQMTHLFKGSLTGFTNNRNAFGIQILITLVLFYSLCDQPIKKHLCWGIALLLFGIENTWSRSCQSVIVGLVLLALFLRALNWKEVYRVSIRFAAVNALYFLGLYFFIFLTTTSWNTLSLNTLSLLSLGAYSGEYSDHERWYTMLEGLKLWWSYPLWGAGLGAFVFKEFALKKNFLIIHNSPIWILAEFGLAGASLFIRYIYQIVCGLFKTKAPLITRRQDYALWGVLLCAGAMSMAHEILYQKIIWIALGMVLTKLDLKNVQN